MSADNDIEHFTKHLETMQKMYRALITADSAEALGERVVECMYNPDFDIAFYAWPMVGEVVALLISLDLAGVRKGPPLPVAQTPDFIKWQGKPFEEILEGAMTTSPSIFLGCSVESFAKIAGERTHNLEQALEYAGFEIIDGVISSFGPVNIHNVAPPPIKKPGGPTPKL